MASLQKFFNAQPLKCIAQVATGFGLNKAADAVKSFVSVSVGGAATLVAGPAAGLAAAILTDKIIDAATDRVQRTVQNFAFGDDNAFQVTYTDRTTGKTTTIELPLQYRENKDFQRNIQKVLRDDIEMAPTIFMLLTREIAGDKTLNQEQIRLLESVADGTYGTERQAVFGVSRTAGFAPRPS